MRPKAYSYLRFSTPEQARGDSFRRQTMLTEDYVAKHGLELDTELTFQDLGVSAYRGKNIETGALAAFKQAVEDGVVAPGSYLLVESLDRISRQAARRAMSVLGDIVDLGATVVTLSDGRAYDKDTLDSDPTALLLALLTFIRANEESATKGKRLRAAWTAKRLKAAEGKPLTSICPAWLSLAPDRQSFVVVEDRAEVVRSIFSMVDAGLGLHGVAAKLNEQGIPTFGMHGRKAEAWGRSYVTKIIENSAVVGTFIPHTVEHLDGVKRRIPGLPVENYFPAVVDREVYRRVQSIRLAAHTTRQRATTSRPVSTLAGLAECPVCGGTMTRVFKGAKGGKPRLVCVRAKRGACGAASAVLEEVERAIEEKIDQIIAEAPLGGEVLQSAISNAEGAVDASQRDVEAAFEVFQGTRSPVARQRLTELEARLTAAQTELQELEERRAAAGPGLRKRLTELKAALRGQPREPQKINAALCRVFQSVVVDHKAGMVTFRWLAGGESDLSFRWGSGPEGRLM